MLICKVLVGCAGYGLDSLEKDQMRTLKAKVCEKLIEHKRGIKNINKIIYALLKF